MVRTLLTAARLILYHYLWKRESSLKCSIPSMCPPPLNNTSCIYHDSRPVYNKPSNMRNISKYFQCLSIYKIDKFTNIHIHDTNMDIHYYISSILWLPSVVCLPAASRQRSSDMSSFCTMF